jgi:hypothetical protein
VPQASDLSGHPVLAESLRKHACQVRTQTLSCYVCHEIKVICVDIAVIGRGELRKPKLTRQVLVPHNEGDTHTVLTVGVSIAPFPSLLVVSVVSHHLGVILFFK